MIKSVFLRPSDVTPRSVTESNLDLSPADSISPDSKEAKILWSHNEAKRTRPCCLAASPAGRFFRTENKQAGKSSGSRRRPKRVRGLEDSGASRRTEDSAVSLRTYAAACSGARNP